MAVSLKELLKQLDDAAKAFDEAELVYASGKLASTIYENIATHPQGFVAELKKAGNSKKKGFRSVVRGVAMNPIDHPHGGNSNGATHV